MAHAPVTFSWSIAQHASVVKPLSAPVKAGFCKTVTATQKRRNVQAASNGLANAEVNVQSEYQNYSFVTVNQAQTMQLIIFVFMFFGAIGFYFWFLKPLFKLLDQVRSKLVHCSCAVPALCCIAVDQTAAKHCSDVLTEPLQLLSFQSIWKSLHTQKTVTSVAGTKALLCTVICITCQHAQKIHSFAALPGSICTRQTYEHMF